MIYMTIMWECIAMCETLNTMKLESRIDGMEESIDGRSLPLCIVTADATGQLT